MANKKKNLRTRRTRTLSENSTIVAPDNYLAVYRRMYAATFCDSFEICLECVDRHDVSISVTLDVFDKFLKCELPFDDLLLIYTSLCVKYGSLS